MVDYWKQIFKNPQKIIKIIPNKQLIETDPKESSKIPTRVQKNCQSKRIPKKSPKMVNYWKQILKNPQKIIKIIPKKKTTNRDGSQRISKNGTRETKNLKKKNTMWEHGTRFVFVPVMKESARTHFIRLHFQQLRFHCSTVHLPRFFCVKYSYFRSLIYFPPFPPPPSLLNPSKNNKSGSFIRQKIQLQTVQFRLVHGTQKPSLTHRSISMNLKQIVDGFGLIQLVLIHFDQLLNPKLDVVRQLFAKIQLQTVQFRLVHGTRKPSLTH